MRPLVVATQNPGKLAELKQYLTGLSWDLTLMPPTLDIEETGKTFQENAFLKASQTAKFTNSWAIADDSGLSVKALEGAPGIYSARYGKTDADRINRLLSELSNTSDRSAHFTCVIALSNPQGKIILHAEGICPGEILTKQKGSGGFGYDPIFYVSEAGQTYAEMSKESKRKISHRGRALAQLLEGLKALNP